MTNVIQGTFGPKRPAGLPTGDKRTPESQKKAAFLGATLEEHDARKYGDKSEAEVLAPDGQSLSELNPQQEKAIMHILSGKSFVFVAMAPTVSGSDFFTAVHGDPGELLAAEDHLPEVIHKAYLRNNITEVR